MMLSAIMPCHNNERWVKTAIKSVIAQTRSPNEIIIILDRSTDRSEELIRHINDPRIQVISTNFGNAAAARNFGVSQAKGKWIAFLDCDDWWTLDHIQIALDTLERSKDGAYFAHWNEYLSETEQIAIKPALGFAKVTSGLNAEDFYQQYLMSKGWPTSGMVLSREVFEAVGGFDESQLRRHDTELFARCVHAVTWSYNPKPGFYYRKQVSGSISTVSHEVKYFRLRSDLKIAALFKKNTHTRRIKNHAKSCAAEAILYGDSELRKKALELCEPYLGIVRIIFLKTGPCVPRLILTILQKIHYQRKLAARKTARIQNP